MIDEARVQAHAQVGVMSEIDEVEKQHHALRRCEIGKPRDSRRTPPSRIEKRDPPEERERQKTQQRKPQVEFGSQIKGLDQVSPGCPREGVVKRDPERDPECREHDEIDRGQRKDEAGESWESIEHFRGDSRRLAPMSRTAI